MYSAQALAGAPNSENANDLGGACDGTRYFCQFYGIGVVACVASQKMVKQWKMAC